MALRLLSPGRRTAVLYGRSLRQISAGLRPLSTKDDVVYDREMVVEVRQLRLSATSELLGDTDRRLPLPGGRGLAEELSPLPLPPSPPPPPANGRRTRNDTAAELFHDRHMATLVTYLSPVPGEPAPSDAAARPEPVILEIQAHDCPQLLKEEFRPLFRERDLAAGRLTVLVVSQRTEGDMATWSEEIEAERDELGSHFVSVGLDIALNLRRLGFWADLVDPRTGRPHLDHLGQTGHPSAADVAAADGADTLVETDERLGRLGFTIDDLGCCKVIRHAAWGSHVFIGCLFTDAPMTDPRLGDVLSQYQAAPPAPSS